MNNSVINAFQKGKWFAWSNSLLGNKAKMASLLALLPKYLKKGGLSQAQTDLRLLGHYIGDVIHGRYNGYNASALSLAAAAIVYTLSPLDLAPDFVPLGLLDDMTILTWAMAQLSEELNKYDREIREQGIVNQEGEV